MRGNFMNYLLGGLAGAGRGMAQQQQFKSQEADAQLDREYKGFQLAQMKGPAPKKWHWDTERGVFLSDDGDVREVPGIGPRAKQPRYEIRGSQRIDVDAGKATPIEGYVEPVQQPTQRNVDPLSDAGIAQAAKRAAAIAAATPKPKSAMRALPSSAVEKLTGIDNMMTMATEVRDALQGAVKDNVDVTGRVGGVLPTPGWVKDLTNKGGATGKDVRALIGNLYATIAKERGGTALSGAEIQLLESYIPNQNEDEKTATIKANRFIRTLRAMRENKIKNYQQYGFGVDDEAPMQDHLPGNPFVTRPPDA